MIKNVIKTYDLWTRGVGRVNRRKGRIENRGQRMDGWNEVRVSEGVGKGTKDSQKSNVQVQDMTRTRIKNMSRIRKRKKH